jgi:hypothetical protein
MFITKRSMPRRTFVRGLGVTLAVPFLDAMAPALVATAKTASRQPRVGFVYVPNGAIMSQWTPSTTGAGFEFTPILKPLESFRDSVMVVTNLACPEPDNSHAGAAGSWLTGVAPKRTAGADFRAGTTIDQVIAGTIGQDTSLSSLEVATEDFTGLVGGCTTNYSCAYVNTLNWRTPTTPLPMEINPRAVFERLFGAGGGTREQRIASMRMDRSVLDFVTQAVRDLERELGGSDRLRLAEYLDHVREVEQRIQRAEQQSDALLTIPDAPVGVPESFEEHVGLMFELLALACEADLTRVFTFMMARELSQRTYTQIGLSETHHRISHHSNRPEKIEEHARINAYHMQLFAKFVDRLQSTPDGDGSLLDHALIVYGCGMSEGNTHSPYPLPTLVVGNGAGRLKGNRHIAAPERTPMANLLWSLADKVGTPLNGFGVGTGTLEI